MIGADLPYLNAVCEPSLVFDPLSVESMENAFVDAVTLELPSSRQKSFNKINEIIDLLLN